MKKDAFGVVSKHRSKVRLVLREIGSNGSSAGYAQAKRKSKVSKAMKLPDGSWVRLRARSLFTPGTRTVSQHSVLAHRRGELVGGLHMAGGKGVSDAGTILSVGVAPEMRRKGVASAMWSRAKKKGYNPQHSNFRTGDGDAWARSVGGRLPKNSAVAAKLDEI